MSTVTVSFYDKTTGMFSGVRYHGLEDHIEVNTPNGHAAAIGAHDHLSKRVDLATGELVDYQPPAPSADHEWNADTKRWQLTAAAAEKESKRAFALNRIDHLENSQARALRELALGSTEAAARLKAIDDEIASLRSHLR
jgi:hypothetical protein